jgi:outer membrane murein-binding lipoprotein Lpp
VNPVVTAALSALALAALLAQEPPENGSFPASDDPAATPTPAPVLKMGPRPTPKEIGVGGSSLADIARRNRAEKEKEAKKKSLGVITNETLRKGSPATVTPPPPKGTEKPVAHRVVGAPTPTPGIPEPKDFEGRTESDWRRKSGEIKARLALADTNVKKLEAEVRRLENDFYAWSDGNYRDRVIKPALDQARADLDKAKHDAEDAKAKLDNLEDDARKSGAPPGWIR